MSHVQNVNASEAYPINRFKNVKRKTLWIFVGMLMRYWHYLGRKVNVLWHFASRTGSFKTTVLELGATWRSASQSVRFNLLERTPGTYR
jgi:hypothetical protein